jgi:hypothetical protein
MEKEDVAEAVKKVKVEELEDLLKFNFGGEIADEVTKKEIMKYEAVADKIYKFLGSNKSYLENYNAGKGFLRYNEKLDTIEYFDFKDNYEDFRLKHITHVQPMTPANKMNLGQGLYGVFFPRYQSILLHDAMEDSWMVYLHENRHKQISNEIENRHLDYIQRYKN